MPDQMSPLPYAGRIDEQIEWYDAKACWNQLRYKRLQATIIVLSALTPLLLAGNLLFVPVEPRWDHYVLILLPIVVSVAATVVAATLTTFKYHDNWVQYRETCERLRREQFLYESKANDYARAPHPERLLARHAEEIMAGENAKWRAFVSGPDE
jgi:hypothetical protein